MSENSSWLWVGLRTYCPSSRPTRTAAMGPWKGMGDMVLLQPNDKVYKILDLLGFTKIFNVALKEEEIEAFFTPT